LALATVPVGAEIYRWTDAAGGVHYSDRAPADGTDAERIVPPAAAAAPDPELERSRARSRKLLEVWDAERRERDEAAAETAAREREHGQACAQLRAELERSRRATYLFREAQDGAREIVGAEDRARYERELAEAFAAHCS
jgi:Domain of unknown function (DUF4124)